MYNNDMEQLKVKSSQNKEVIDLTSQISKLIKQNKYKNGIIYLFVKHTTCSLTIADLDPGTDQDYLDAIQKMFPKGKYRHPHDPSHVGDHIMSSIIGHSVMVPVAKGKMDLGTWQSIVLIELSGPRDRNVVAQFIST